MTVPLLSSRRMLAGVRTLVVWIGIAALAACTRAADEPRPPGPAPSCAGIRAGGWDPAFALPGVEGDGRADAVVRAPDGRVFVGGTFTRVAGIPARNVAVHDGRDWAPVGAGVPFGVHDLAVDAGGSLWALGRDAVDPDLAYLARWDGATWDTVVAAAGIDTLATTGDAVLVGGRFTELGGVTAAGLARYADGAWSAPAIPTLASGAASISTIAITADGWCVAGGFDAIDGVAVGGMACWDGAAWSPLGDGRIAGAEVAVLARGLDGTWYAGGEFGLLDDGDLTAGIARLDDDGRWRGLDGGVGGLGFLGPPSVRAIAPLDDRVIVAGSFAETVGSDLPVGLLAWSPRDGWRELAGGTYAARREESSWIVEAAAIEPDGAIVIVGQFDGVGDALAPRVARISADGVPAALPVERSLAGAVGVGAVESVSGGVIAVGAVRASGLPGAVPFAWLDDAWTAPQAGPMLADSLPNDAVVRDGVVVAVAQGTPDGFRYLDGDAWQEVAVDGYVTALLPAADDVIVVAVDDGCASGGPSCSRILTWDGSALAELGTLDDPIWELVWEGPNLVALSTWRGARFEAGQWSSYGLDLPQGWRMTGATTCGGGELVATGTFPDGDDVAGLAVRDADGWHPIHGSDAWSIAVGDDALYVAGDRESGSQLGVWRFGAD